MADEKKPRSEKQKANDLRLANRRRESYALFHDKIENFDNLNVEISDEIKIIDKTSDEKIMKECICNSYPKAIMLTVEDAFIDPDGMRFRFPAHKLIESPTSIRLLVDRDAHYTVIR